MSNVLEGVVKKLAIGLVVLVVAVIGVGAGLYFGGYLKAPEIKDVRLSWGEVTAQTTTVNAEMLINNRLPVGIGSGNVGLAVLVDFYDVNAVSLLVPELRLDKGESTLTAEGTLRQATLPVWWPQFVNNGEVLAIRVRPEARVKILGRRLSTGLPTIGAEVPIPLMRELGSTEPLTMGFDTPSRTELAKEFQEAPAIDVLTRYFKVGPPRPDQPVLTIESWELRWGSVTQETTQVLGTIVLRNETPLPLPIQGLRVAVDMNGITVLPEAAVTPDRAELPPGQSVPLKLAVAVNNLKLVEWLTSHIRRDETTTVTVSIGVTVVLPGGGLPGLPSALELPLVPVPGFKCDIKTDILGAANHAIGRILGTREGEGPEPATVNCSRPPTPKIGPLGELLPPREERPRPQLPGPAPTLPGPSLSVTPVPSPLATVVATPPPMPALSTPLPTPTLSPMRTRVPTTIPLLTPTPSPTPTMFSVTVSVTPAGFGTVALAPPGGSYAAGTTVTLTAVPAPGYVFDRWEGDASGTSPTVTVTMDGPKAVEARFRRLL